MYSPVPVRLRQRLDERLKLLVEYERKHPYEKVYDLFSDTYLVHLKSLKRGSKSEYIAFVNSYSKSIPEFIDFVITSVEKKGDDSYVIQGSVKSRYHNEIYFNTGGLDARWQNGDWYFSELSIQIEE